MANDLRQKFDLADAGNKTVPVPSGGQIELREFKSTNAVVKAMLLMILTTEKIKCISILVVCREDNVIPHWTFEFVQTSRPGAAYMCFVDFLSRIDLGVELDYVKQVYTPLSPIKKEFEAIIADKPATELQLIQRCCHSPWATALAFPNTVVEQVIPRFNKFYEHFLSLTQAQLSGFIRLSAEQQIERDRKQRNYIYNIEVDPIWMIFRGVLGADAVELLLNAYVNLGFN